MGTHWLEPPINGPNRLHLTAVGQSLAFTPQALKLRPRNQAWRQQAIDSLPRWEAVVADILGSIPDEEVPSSEYRPPRTNGLLRISPIQLPQAKQTQCWRLPTNRDAQRDADEANLTLIRRAGTHRYGAISDRDSQRRSIWHQHQLRKGRSRGRRKIIGITAR